MKISFQLLLLVLTTVCGLHLRQCNPDTCKNVAFDCMEQPECSKQFTQCLTDFRKFITSDNAYEQFENCMNKSVASGKVLGCAKTQCPNSAAKFIAMIFNSAQSKSFIQLELGQSITAQ